MTEPPISTQIMHEALQRMIFDGDSSLFFTMVIPAIECGAVEVSSTEVALCLSVRGKPVSEQQIQEWADEAEAGYQIEEDQ